MQNIGIKTQIAASCRVLIQRCRPVVPARTVESCDRKPASNPINGASGTSHNASKPDFAVAAPFAPRLALAVATDPVVAGNAASTREAINGTPHLAQQALNLLHAGVIEGAGGSITDWQGKPLDAQSDGHVLALGDPALLEDVVSILG